jgi:hypothetical protein
VNGREEMLDRVRQCVCNDRDQQYGPPEDSFGRVAAIANVTIADYLAKPMDEIGVALFLASLKMGRLAHNPEHLDSWTDLAGYSVCGGSIVLGRQEP